MNRAVPCIAMLSLLACPSLRAEQPAKTRPASRPATQPTTQPGERVAFCGIESRGRRIVYVCDATGTMIMRFEALRAAINASVAALDPKQTFNVVLYRDGPRTLQFSPDPLPATAENKAAPKDFLDDAQTMGTTDPVPALEAAFKQDPDLVFFANDGGFSSLRSYEEFAKVVSRLNRERRARVDTIVLDAYTDEAIDSLKTIAKDSGGKFAIVNDADLERFKAKP